MLPKFNLFVIGTVALLRFSSAVSADGLSIEQAIDKAVANHPYISSKRFEKNAAESDEKAAYLSYFPSVGVSALRGDTGSSLRTLTIQQPLWTGGKLDGQYDLAKANLSAAEVGITEAQQDILTETVGRFLDFYRAEQSAVLASSNIAEHQRLLEIIERRVAAQTSPDVDAKLAMARLQYAESEALQFENAARAAQSALSQLVGDEVSTLSTPLFEVSLTLELEQLRKAAQDFSPVLAKLLEEENVLTAKANIAKAEMYPTLSLGYEKRFGDVLIGQEQEQVYLALDYKPGAGFSSGANYSAAKARKYALIDSRRAAERELKVQVETLWSQYSSSQRQLEPAQILVESTLEVVDSYLRQYVVGRKSWLDVLNAQREATQAKYTLVNAKVLFLQSYYQLRILTGLLRADTAS